MRLRGIYIVKLLDKNAHDNNSHSDSDYNYLGYLGQCDTNRNNMAIYTGKDVRSVTTQLHHYRRQYFIINSNVKININNVCNSIKLTI
jgi:hypothetical protein